MLRTRNEYPRPHFRRDEWLSLNGTWEFEFDDNHDGEKRGIHFHSLEDRAVKRYFEQVTKPEIDRPEWPAPRPNPDYAARAVYRKPVTPSAEELQANPRSRSAKLRVIEKL